MLKSEKELLVNLNKKFQNNRELLRYLDLYTKKMQEDLENDLLEGRPEFFVDFQSKKIQGIVQLKVSLEKEDDN